MRRITGTGRVLIGRFTYDWPGERCLIAYTSHGPHGIAAVVPTADGVAPSLWDVAARHLPPNIIEARRPEEYGQWCLRSAWALEVLRTPGTLRLDGAEWTLDVRHKVDEFKPHQYGRAVYGQYGVQVGVLTLDDPELMSMAQKVLTDG